MTHTQLAVITDYRELIVAFRARAAACNIAIGGSSAAELAGLPDRYIGKLLGPSTLGRGKNARRVGMISLGPLLGLLGVKLMMVVDPEATERMAGRIVARNESCVRSSTVHIEISGTKFRKMQAKGGRNSRKYMSQAKASKLGAKAARARWAKGRARKRQTARQNGSPSLAEKAAQASP